MLLIYAWRAQDGDARHGQGRECRLRRKRACDIEQLRIDVNIRGPFRLVVPHGNVPVAYPVGHWAPAARAHQFGVDQETSEYPFTEATVWKLNTRVRGLRRSEIAHIDDATAVHVETLAAAGDPDIRAGQAHRE